jgi:benzodiazapine receptor
MSRRSSHISRRNGRAFPSLAARGGGLSEGVKREKNNEELEFPGNTCFIYCDLSCGFRSGSTFYRRFGAGVVPGPAEARMDAPSWLFGPVWTILYLMMAFAAWLVWRRRKSARVRGAMVLFFIQLIVNAAWSPLFFGLQNPLAGLLDIVLLWAAILATLIAFRRISSTAAALLVPYWLWVSYAAALYFAIWTLNR